MLMCVSIAAYVRSLAPQPSIGAKPLVPIRRRLKRGELEGRRETTPQGFRWLAAMPDAPGALRNDDKRDHDSDIVIVQRDRDLIETLQRELSEGQETGAPVVKRVETLWQRVRRLIRG